jgi:group I intron endonuclease
MIKKIGVYCIENTKTKTYYIGSSDNLDHRIYIHFWLLKSNKHVNIHLQRSYNKYGKKRFKHSILEFCEIAKLEEREQYWLDTYKYNFKYKIFNFGEIAKSPRRGIKMSKKHCRKMSKLFLGKDNPFYGKKHSEETKKKISKANKGKLSGKNNPFYGKTQTKKIIEKMKKSRKYLKGKDNPLYGKPISDDLKRKISMANKGRIRHNRKPIVQEDLNGNIINKFYSIMLASNFTGISRGGICACAKGKTKTAGGFIWKYDTNPLPPQVNKNYPKIKQFDINGNLINIFDTVSDASKYIGRDTSLIYCCLVGSRETTGGYVWKREL